MPEATRADRAAVLLALGFPSLVTLAYFVLAAEAPAVVQQTTYAVGKALQFAWPLVWIVLVRRRRLTFPAPRGKDLALGAAFGGAVLAATVGLYALVLLPAGLFDAALGPIADKVQSLGIDSVSKYAALGVFYALVHALLEEYYWRWYVFAELRRFLPLSMAIGLSSVGFMAHHVLVLGGFFGFAAPLTWLLSLSVAVGGVVWAWMYERQQALWGVWLSHLLVDAGIFLVGYHLLQAVFTGH